MPEACATSGANPPIADYAIIGDCQTAALVAEDGCVDWFCPARFDAPAVFCRILDAQRGGYFRIAPRGAFTTERRYRDQSNILETLLSAAGGRVRLVDFMPVRGRARSSTGQDVTSSDRIVRLIEGVDGALDLDLCLKPTFDYARADCTLEKFPCGALASTQSFGHLALACPDAEWQVDEGGLVSGHLRVTAGEQRWVTLSWTRDLNAARLALQEGEQALALEETEDYWRNWAARCTYQGPYRQQVVRSALTLKLLTYEPTGALVAAPTTSLPEAVGGARNWDYRYAWLRDSALILYALMTIGYQEEAEDFFHWLRRTQQAEQGQAPQIMYTVTGGRDLPEVELKNLAGYRDSRPVRIGNRASQQFQLDVYGELLTAAYLHYSHQRGDGTWTYAGHRPSAETWALLRSLVEQAAAHWQEPDKGIWEMRSAAQQFLYSRLMCWAALDRGIRLAEEYRLPAPLDQWQATRDAIRQAIETQGYDERQGAFTQAFGSTNLDASALLIPRLGFLPPTDPRVRSTVDQIRASLMMHGFVFRYRTPDGLPGGEGAFIPCTFWLVDALALGGRQTLARDVFEHAIDYTNALGLLSEEVDPASGELLGNFPQGLTHTALIVAAVDQAKAARHGAEQAPENEAQRAGPAHKAAAEDVRIR